MANIIHLRCRHCGEPLENRESAYCPPCNIYLAYRAMPFLLGLMLTGHLATDLGRLHPDGLPAAGIDTAAYEDDAVLIWE
ncbi:MAG: hypothetical protein FDZ69_09375 [Deltaproteobacteria bacterium]|nr:MAG: hypothetical protein FDZ69_09375 [Deltaproteobacteria bacterium]